MAALLCAVGFVFPGAHAQTNDAVRKVFLEYKAKAEQGLALAQFDLSVCYEGGQGVEKDYTEAYAWYNMAAKTEDNAAKKRDKLEEKMSPQ